MLPIQASFLELERCTRPANPPEHASSYDKWPFPAADYGTSTSTYWSPHGSRNVGYPNDADGWRAEDREAVEGFPR